MNGLRRLAARLHGVMFARRLDEALGEELRAHLEMLADDYVRSGMSPEEARRQARLRLGGVEQTKELVRDARAFSVVDILARDLKLAFRSIRRNPRFACVAIAILAFGIGANTAPFAILYGSYWRPLPGLTQVNRLIRLRLGCDGCAYEWFDDEQVRRVAARRDLFSDLTAFQQLQADLAGSAGALRVSMLAVGDDYFQTLGVRLVRGRPFVRGAAGAEPSPAAIISERLWRTHFSSVDSVVGTHVSINGVDLTIAGVAPRGFVGANMVGWENGIWNPDVWVPASMYGTLIGDSVQRGKPVELSPNHLIARLQPGITVARVNAELGGLASQWATSAERLRGYRVLAAPVRGASSGEFEPRMIAVFVFPAIVFLVACANLCALLLARGVSRAHEVAVRRALGAGTWQIVRQQLVEDAILALAGGGLGLVVSTWIANVIVAQSRTTGLDVTPDARLVAVTIAIAAAAVLSFGLLPALIASRARFQTGANPTSVGQPRRRARLQRGLVVGQVALSLMLLAAGAVLLQAVRREEASDSGIDISGTTLTASLDLASHHYTPDRRRMFEDALARDVSALPGVEAASLAGRAPFGHGSVYYATIDRAPLSDRAILGLRVSPGYLRTVRLPLLRGRDFAPGDMNGPAVALVSAELARLGWPDADPIGQSFPMSPAGSSLPRRLVTVVGVVGDVTRRDPIYGARTLLYLPLKEDDGEAYPAERISLLVRFGGDGMGGLPAVREALRRIDPNMSLFDIATVRALADRATARERVTSLALAGLGLAGLMMACIGTFGVMAHAAAQRTREVGIRLALGARPADVVRMGVRDGGRLAGAGVAAGLVLGVAVSRVLVSFVVPGQAMGLGSIVASVGLVVAALLLACYLPARRASRIDPVSALHCD